MGYSDGAKLLAANFEGFSYEVAGMLEESNIDQVADRDRARMSVVRIAGDIGYRPRYAPAEARIDYLDWLTGHREVAGYG